MKRMILIIMAVHLLVTLGLLVWNLFLTHEIDEWHWRHAPIGEKK